MTQRQINIHARRTVRLLADAESYVRIEVVEGDAAPRRAC